MTATIAQAVQFLERGDLAAAEAAAMALLAARPDDPGALHVMGVVRFQQRRPADAALLLGRAVALQPDQPQPLRHHAAALSQLGSHAAAAAALAQAVRLAPELAEAWLELGKQQQVLGEQGAAEASYRTLLALEPRHPVARLALGSLLLEAGRAGEAEILLAEGFAAAAADPPLAIEFGHVLIYAQRLQGRKEAALESLARLQALAPQLGDELDILRGHLLDELFRFEEALAVMDAVLRRDPGNEAVHDAYNDLLYRLGRETEFLSSYERAPATAPLLLAKASFLRHARRPEEAHSIFADILAREPDNTEAVSGTAQSLGDLNRHDEAVRLLERALARQPGDAGLNIALATAALRGRDPEKSAAMAERGLAARPGDHLALALLGSAWRLMDDTRDETLNGYDRLVRIFDLEPPEGFGDMASFNEELAQALARQHPATREFLSQSLRGGTQAGNLFEGGHALVKKLRQRLSEGVSRYIAQMPRDESHPLLSRRRDCFSYAGSWSSRLRDCGYHVNHIHPEGWISCCYYVGVPDAAADEEAKQGWIKFGEPAFDIGLGFRRAVQPAPGRLVLFPSYMWHGTIPFRSDAVRTTIAFDVVPNGSTSQGPVAEVPLVAPLLRRGG